jgi:hypothetical protein
VGHMDAEEVSSSSDEPKSSIQSETHSGFAAMYRGRRRCGVRLPHSFGDMGELNQPASRRTFRWPGAARELVRTYLSTAPCRLPENDEQGAQIGLRAPITRIAAVSGNPRGACWRFVRQSGVTSKRSYQQWTRAEQQKLLDLVASRSPREVTMLLRRSPTSVRAMLHRLGAGSRMGQDWFTKHALRTGAFVRIDPRQKKIPSVNWHSDDRPIFFIELRERYVCTWCEMHDGRLILIPTQQSKRRSQQVRHPAEATIIGRVTEVSMDLVVEPSEHEARA